MSLITYDQIVGLLKTNIVMVIFTKVDGTQREMRCTLNTKLLPEFAETAKPKKKKEESTAVAVWDLEVQGWRSFRLDSILEVRLYEDPAVTA